MTPTLIEMTLIDTHKPKPDSNRVTLIDTQTLIDTHKPKPDSNRTDGVSALQDEVLLLNFHRKMVILVKGMRVFVYFNAVSSVYEHTKVLRTRLSCLEKLSC